MDTHTHARARLTISLHNTFPENFSRHFTFKWEYYHTASLNQVTSFHTQLSTALFIVTSALLHKLVWKIYISFLTVARWFWWHLTNHALYVSFKFTKHQTQCFYIVPALIVFFFKHHGSSHEEMAKKTAKCRRFSKLKLTFSKIQ